jgi:RHS repeat-associated protein
MSLNSARADSAETDAFLDRWHTVGLVIRHGTLTATLFLDGKPLLDGVPLVQGAWAGASPDIIVRCAGAASVRIEDLEARYKDLELKPKTAGEEVSQALVKDSFEGYPTGVFPDQGGWLAGGAQALGLVQDSQLESGQGAAMLRSTSNRKANSREGEKALAEGTEEARLAGLQMTADSEASLESGKAVVDETDSVTGLKSFRIETDRTGELVVAKRLSLPSRVPFGVSEGNFMIGVAKTASQVRTISRSRLVEELGLGDRPDRSRKEEDWVSDRKSETANEEQVPGIVKAGRTPSGSGDKTMKLMSASPVGNYYLYSFDGKLLQTYNVYGVLLKDYIYMGDRLIAEYDHVGNRYLYYTPDQINSTRVITDSAGTVVYSAVHDPYGGIQQTGTNNTYDPQLKFSGKERDEESQLDYFGARYYDHTLYRFLSVDPVISARAALYDPQRWNLYGYCRGNPISFLDPDGKQTIEIWRSRYGTDATYGIYRVELGQRVITGYTLEPARGVGKGPIPLGTYDAKEYWWPKYGYQVFWLQDVEGFEGVFIHKGATPDDTTGCPLFGKGRYSGGITGSKRAMDELVYEIANFRAERIEESIGGFFFDLDYLNFLTRTQVQIRDLPEGTVSCTWTLTRIL